MSLRPSLPAVLAAGLAIAATYLASSAAVADSQTRRLDFTIGTDAGLHDFIWDSVGTSCDAPSFEVCTTETDLASGQILMDAFDPSLGPLERVTLRLTAQFTGSNEFTERPAAPWITPTHRVEFGLGLPFEPDYFRSRSLIDQTCDSAVLAGGSCAIDYSLGFFWQPSFTDSATLALFTGPGELSFDVSAAFDLVHAADSSDGNLPAFDGSFWVTYQYVPESGTGALLVLGLTVGVAGARRRCRC